MILFELGKIIDGSKQNNKNFSLLKLFYEFLMRNDWLFFISTRL